MIRVYEWEKEDHLPLDLRLVEARARSGNAEANCAMADFYMRGRYHYEKNSAKAMRFLDEAMGKRYPQSYYIYAEWLMDPTLNKRIDYNKAVKFYERSADLGFGRGMARVGEAFLRGWGVDINYVAAEEWLIRSHSLEARGPLLELADIIEKENNRHEDAKRLREIAASYKNNP